MSDRSTPSPANSSSSEVRDLAHRLADAVDRAHQASDETAIRTRMQAIVAAGADSADIVYSEITGGLQVQAFGLDGTLYAEEGDFQSPVRVSRLYADATTVLITVRLPGESITTMLDHLFSIIAQGQATAA